jgi:Phage integrase family
MIFDQYISFFGALYKAWFGGDRRVRAAILMAIVLVSVAVAITVFAQPALLEKRIADAAILGSFVAVLTFGVIEKLAPHDLRRTCARLCHSAGGELDQIRFLLGHVSIQTTERYLGCKQRLRCVVNDRLGIEPDAA